MSDTNNAANLLTAGQHSSKMRTLQQSLAGVTVGKLKLRYKTVYMEDNALKQGQHPSKPPYLQPLSDTLQLPR